MGSAGASSKPIQDINPSLQTISNAMADDQTQSKSNTKTPLENPGTMEELHKRCKGYNYFIYYIDDPR